MNTALNNLSLFLKMPRYTHSPSTSRLLSPLRSTLIPLACIILSGCANLQNLHLDGKAWRLDGFEEAESFYKSNLDVSSYVLSKQNPAIPLHKRNDIVNMPQFCTALTTLGDFRSARLCLQEFDVITEQYASGLLALYKPEHQSIAAPSINTIQNTMKGQSRLARIGLSEGDLEQGNFDQVITDLEPNFSVSTTASGMLFDMSSEQKEKINAYAKMMATPHLMTAYRAKGMKPSPAVSAFINSNEQAIVNIIGSVSSYKANRLMIATKQMWNEDYAGCADTVEGLTEQIDIGLFPTFSLLLDPIWGGAASAQASMTKREILRLESFCATQAKRPNQARAASERILSEGTELAIPPAMTRLAYFRLGLIASEQGDNSKAVNYWKQTVDLLERERSAFDSESSRMGFLTEKGEVYSLLIDALVTQGNIAEAFEYAERAKARSLIDMLASRRDQRDDKITDGRFTRLARQADIAYFQKALTELRSDNEIATSQTRSIDNSRSTSGSLPLPHDASKAERSLLTVEASRPAELQALLGPDETLLQFFGTEKNLHVFVVTKDSIKSAVINKDMVKTVVKSFREDVQSTKRFPTTSSKALYDLIIAPVDKHLSRTRLLTVVPHGELHYIPFNALHDGKQALIAKFPIRLLPSASILQIQPPALEEKTALGNYSQLIFGNPDLGDRSLDLPGAQLEAVSLSKLDPKSRVLLRKQASETALRELAPQARSLHLAMHGKFDPAAPLKSGLYMAADERNDGVLTAAELYDLNLNLDLVVMSACETGLSDVSKGNDVLGLNRGFLFAGSRTLVSSLWEVDDAATKDLMMSFYKARATHNKAEALRLAQLELMKRHKHPFYWAAFQLTGQP